jgi:hypothetical protein
MTLKTLSLHNWSRLKSSSEVKKEDENIFIISYEKEPIRYEFGYYSGLRQTEVLLYSTASWYVRKKVKVKHQRDIEMFLRAIKVRVKTFPFQYELMGIKHKSGNKKLDRVIEVIRYSKVNQNQIDEIKQFLVAHKRVAAIYAFGKIYEWVRSQGKGGQLFDLDLSEWYALPPVIFYFILLLFKRRYIQSHAYPFGSPEQKKSDVEALDKLIPALIEFLREHRDEDPRCDLTLLEAICIELASLYPKDEIFNPRSVYYNLSSIPVDIRCIEHLELNINDCEEVYSSTYSKHNCSGPVFNNFNL